MSPISVWRVATEGPGWKATDLDGKGMALSGGRWNHVNTHMVYAASSIALACLETVVHLNAYGLPLKRYLVEVQIPHDVWQDVQTLVDSTLPPGWDDLPSSQAAADFGTAWANSQVSALLRVPSVIVPQESNYLLNPAHPGAQRITALNRGPFKFDARLLRQPAQQQAQTSPRPR